MDLLTKELYPREQKSHPMLQMPEFLQWNIPIGLLDASCSYVSQNGLTKPKILILQEKRKWA